MDLEQILRRGVAEIIPEEELRRKLACGRPLRLKQGFDPSRPDIHLGHAVGLRKLRQLQQLGHQVILIVGDWTAQIGDPSGASATRPMLSREEVQRNAQTYLQQFFQIVDRQRTQIAWQSEWYGSFGLAEVIQLATKFTVAQMLAREDFAKRYEAGSPISLTELLYPLLQAYDSVAIQADVEFGGTDQKFNCLIGRELQRIVGQEPQAVFLVPLLTGTDGVQKMSKSFDNYIGITQPPDQMYGKVMSIPDSLMLTYFEWVTDVPLEEIRSSAAAMASGALEPMELKKRLAREIVTQFHSAMAAAQAEEEFRRIFQEQGLPSEMPEFVLVPGKYDRSITGLVHLMVDAGLVASSSEARRLLAQGGVRLDGAAISLDQGLVPLGPGAVLRVGRRRFLRLVAPQNRLSPPTP